MILIDDFKSSYDVLEKMLHIAFITFVLLFKKGQVKDSWLYVIRYNYMEYDTKYNGCYLIG